MALQFSLQFPSKPPFLSPSKPLQSLQFRSLCVPHPSPPSLHKLKTLTNSKLRRTFIPTAIEQSKGENQNEETISDAATQSASESETELGTEIKKAMAERKEEKVEGDLWSGVAEEIKEIEWPAFGKVAGITGVVLGVIAGSSVVLLTVNAVLAEFSDRVFAGRGVQDFFG